MIPRRIGEHGTTRPFADRLRRFASREEQANIFVADARSRLKLQTRAQVEFVRGTTHMAIADLVFMRSALMAHAVAINGFNAEDMAPRFAAKSAGVHRQCAA